MSQRAAIRKRKQIAKGYRHLAPLKRPHYPKAPGTAAAAVRRDERWRVNKSRGLF